MEGNVKLKGRFIGRRELQNHLNGKRLTGRQMAKAKCYDCMSGYPDGAMDCRIHQCPIYPAMPYRGKDSIPLPPGVS